VNNIPLSDASLSEVCARVAYRCIRYYYHHEPNGAVEPLEVMDETASWLQHERFTMLAVWVRAYRHEWAPLIPIKLIRENLIIRARLGQTWRRVAYPAYKRSRCDPRVTNRGVTSRPPRGEK
jgi:hypothetical protein